MSRGDPRECCACGFPVSNRNLERHHFPIAKRNGGKVTIDLCKTCHDAIDRFTLDRDKTGVYLRGWIDMLNTREARIVAMKCVSIAQNLSPESGLIETARTGLAAIIVALDGDMESFGHDTALQTARDTLAKLDQA